MLLYLDSCVVFCFVHSLPAVVTSRLAKGCINELGGAVNQHTRHKPNINRNVNFHRSVERKDVNWLDRLAV